MLSIQQLIDRRCFVSCAINGVALQMLFNSGLQVTMVTRDWVEKMLPNVRIQPLEILLTNGPLDIIAAHVTHLPLDGWIDVTLEEVSVNHGTVVV